MKRPRERTQALWRLTPTLTAVSHRALNFFENWASWGLARPSLLMVVTMALLGAGCMVTGSPDFAEPKTTAPFLTAQNPVTWAVKVVNGVGSPAQFALDRVSFRVLSEDLNRKLLAALVLDYRGFVKPTDDKPMDFPPVKEIDPGHLDPNDMSSQRIVDMDYLLPTGTKAGCHSLTVIVTHDFEATTINPSSDTDYATLTWWLAVQDPLGKPLDLASCVAAAGTTASVDGGNP